MKKICLALVATSLFAAVCGCTSNTTSSTSKADSLANAPAAVVPGAAEREAAPAVVDTDVQTVTGTFESLEWGDYLHFNMKTDAGEELSFFVLSTPEDQLAPFEQGGMEGKKIEVKWRTAEHDIPEAGGKTEVDELLEVKAL